MGPNGKAGAFPDLTGEIGRLDRARRDILNPAARITHEVVMVMPVAVGQFVPRGPPQLHPADDVQRLKEAQGTVDRREVDAPIAERPVNLLGPEGTRDRREDGQDGGPGLRPRMSLPPEEVFDVIYRLAHGDILQMICKIHSSRCALPVKQKAVSACRCMRAVYNRAA
jgi:hypothetical protein